MEFSEDLLKAVNALDLSTRRNVRALLAGNYRSAFRGSGMQFKDFRHYEPGDDVRHISWPVTARTKRTTLKVYEEDRELNVLLLVDVSGSSLFQYGKQTKQVMYAELVALMGLAAAKSDDNVGILLFHDTAEYYLPPRHSRHHVQVAITHLLAQPLENRKSDIRPALRFAERVLKHRSLVIVLSDFMMPDFSIELRKLSARHEIVLLHAQEDAEKGMGIAGVHEVWDPEANEFLLVDTHSIVTRRALGRYHLNLRLRLEEWARKAKADYLSLSVDDDYLKRLVLFFRNRGPSRV